MKTAKLLHIIFPLVFIILSSCNNETNKNLEPETPQNNIQNQTPHDFAFDWDMFKTTLQSGSKSDVLNYVDKTNTSLYDEMTLNYEYIFDDELKSQIKNLNYSDLDYFEYNGVPLKILTIIHHYTDNETTLESLYSLYFEETKGGLKIVKLEIAG